MYSLYLFRFIYVYMRNEEVFFFQRKNNCRLNQKFKHYLLVK